LRRNGQLCTCHRLAQSRTRQPRVGYLGMQRAVAFCISHDRVHEAAKHGRHDLAAGIGWEAAPVLHSSRNGPDRKPFPISLTEMHFPARIASAHAAIRVRQPHPPCDSPSNPCSNLEIGLAPRHAECRSQLKRPAVEVNSGELSPKGSLCLLFCRAVCCWSKLCLSHLSLAQPPPTKSFRDLGSTRRPALVSNQPFYGPKFQTHIRPLLCGRMMLVARIAAEAAWF
jgi:hypothetical protein